MMSVRTQYIILFIILVAVIAWIVYRLVRTKKNICNCGGCPVSRACDKKELKGRKSKDSCRKESCCIKEGKN